MCAEQQRFELAKVFGLQGRLSPRHKDIGDGLRVVLLGQHFGGRPIALIDVHVDGVANGASLLENEKENTKSISFLGK